MTLLDVRIFKLIFFLSKTNSPTTWHLHVFVWRWHIFNKRRHQSKT